MNHITQEHAVALAKKTSMKDIMWVHELCNAAIEHYIAQQAASVDATFKKWNTPIFDEYAPVQHEPENEPAVSLASQAAPDPLVSDDLVICPECCSQFRAIPVNVQKLMLDAGCEPPFTQAAPKHIENSDSLYTSQERVKKSKEFKQMLEAAYLAGFNESGNGYHAEFGADTSHPMWIKDRDNAIAAITTGGSV